MYTQYTAAFSQGEALHMALFCEATLTVSVKSLVLQRVRRGHFLGVIKLDPA